VPTVPHQELPRAVAYFTEDGHLAIAVHGEPQAQLRTWRRLARAFGVIVGLVPTRGARSRRR
jgi:hypothetical protein